MNLLDIKPKVCHHNQDRGVSTVVTGEDSIKSTVREYTNNNYGPIRANRFGFSISIGNQRIRGFEVVKDEHRMNWSEKPNLDHANDKLSFNVDGEVINLHSPSIRLPQRSDGRSAGYDFYTPVDFTIEPGEKVLIWSDIKAYMQDNEVLTLVPRSSSGTKHNLMLSNTVGIIDSSYYENENNDGNIGIGLRNIGDKTVTYKTGDRFAQGIFTQYLVADNDDPISDTRTGGYGSSGR